jgi:hypothetical protein
MLQLAVKYSSGRPSFIDAAYIACIRGANPAGQSFTDKA